MDGVDFTTNPEAFAAANDKADVEYLRSLTLNSAAEKLESLFEFWDQLQREVEGWDRPPPLPNPLPEPTLAILLEGKPSSE
jgi:hypothetical protein